MTKAFEQGTRKKFEWLKRKPKNIFLKLELFSFGFNVSYFEVSALANFIDDIKTELFELICNW